MDWRRAVQSCVNAAVRTHRNSASLDLILSPDIDGIISSCLVSHYARNKFKANVRIVGFYNGKEITVLGNVSNEIIKHALWVDLDVRFMSISHILGQHFLGPLNVRIASGAFNPNTYFHIQTIKTKYPWGTAHLALYGLFDEETCIPGLNDSTPGTIARALLVHADSMYYVCHKYTTNSRRWRSRLFGNNIPKTIEYLVGSNSNDPVYYTENNAKIHKKMISIIKEHVTRSKTLKEMPIEWQTCGGNQTCKGKTPTELASHVHQLTNKISNILGLIPPLTFASETARTMWRGTRLFMYLDEVPNNMELFLVRQNIQSHAITGHRTLSMTQGPPLDESREEEEAPAFF